MRRDGGDTTTAPFQRARRTRSARIVVAGALLGLSCGSDPVGTGGSPPTAGPPVRLAFQNPPSRVEGSAAISPAIRVAVQDAFGTVLPTASHRVSLSILAGPEGASLSGTLEVDAVTGIAEFGDLSIDLPGEYALAASASGLEGAESAAIRTVLTFVDLSAGERHTCGLTVADRIYCWGAAGSGQLGDGGSVDGSRSTPGPVVGDLAFRAVSAGLQHTCGLTTDGRAYCWGLNSGKQLGGGTDELFGRSPTPVVGGLAFATIHTGRHHTCALTEDDETYCWGSNTTGQLGDGTQTTRPEPKAIAAPSPRLAAIDGGDFHTCGFAPPARRGGGGAGYCWGSNGNRQLGLGTDDARSLAPALVAGLLEFTALGAGGQHSCGVTPGGQAYCWGAGGNGRLGHGTDSTRAAPHPVSGDLAFRDLTAGLAHTCALTAGGEAYCWGLNSDGRLGDGTNETRRVPTRVAGPRAFRAIRAGEFHSCGLTQEGEAYCWGSNNLGQLGDGTRLNRSTPVRVIQ